MNALSKPPQSKHRRWAIAGLVTAGLLVLGSFASLLYALSLRATETSWTHWPAVAWQVGQLLAIIAFAFGMWQWSQHRSWLIRHGLAADDTQD